MSESLPQEPRREISPFVKRARKSGAIIGVSLVILAARSIDFNSEEPPMSSHRTYGQCGESRLDSFSSEPRGILGEVEYKVLGVTGTKNCVDMLDEHGTAKASKLDIGQKFDMCTRTDDQGARVAAVSVFHPRYSKTGYVDLSANALKQTEALPVSECDLSNGFKFY